MSRAFVVFTAAAVLAVAHPPAAAAQSARELLARGVEMREEGRDEEALELFRQAHETEPSARALAQIALAEQALGRFVDAEGHLVEALADRDDRWIARRERVLEEALAEIRTHIGELLVDSNLAEAELYIDGRLAAAVPLAEPLRLPAGRVEIEVRAAGHRPVRRLVEIRAGERARETVALEPEEPSGGEGGDEPSEQSATLSIVLFSVAGVSAIAGIAGVIWWVDRQSELDFCDSASCTNRDELAAVRNAAIATTVAGLTIAGGLGVLGFLLLPKDEDGGTAFGCAPALAGLVCRGVF